MKLLLLLGVVFFGVEAESQEIQKLLALARQLNQSLGSLAGHAAKMRRLQASAPNANCRAACPGIQCAWDDTQAIANQVNDPGDQLAFLSAAGDLLGAVCLHETAMTCAVGSADCGTVLSASSLALAPCVCDACANFPKIYEGMGPLMTAMQAMASGDTPTEEQMDSLLTALCPMASVLECLDSNSACSSALASMGDLGSQLNQLAAMKSSCAAAGKSTVYATNYTFTSPTCESTTTSTGVGEDTTSTGAGEDVAGANGLLQLNLLAGSFSLLSILN